MPKCLYSQEIILKYGECIYCISKNGHKLEASLDICEAFDTILSTQGELYGGANSMN